MATARRLLVLSLLLLLTAAAAWGEAVAEEEFTEELLLRPLPDRKALAHFHFRSSTPAPGRHHHLFPKAISHLVQKFHISELELSFTQGRWNYETWGGHDPMSTSFDKVLILDFDKGFLHIDEYPPDANQGFDIPSALVSFPEFNASRRYTETDPMFVSPLLENFKEDSVVKSYTEVLLVPLTTPDFSMPYNVITFTCTVLALYFGSLLNALRRRIGEEESKLKKAAVKTALIPLLLARLRGQKVDPSKSESSRAYPAGLKLLLKVVFVAVVAVVYHYLSDS